MEEIDDDRWRAVRERDKDSNDAFVYAVTTTMIFCRPGCASRTPRRENVEFFETASAALAATFRTCRRCRPEEDRRDDPAMRAALCRLFDQGTVVDVALFAANYGYSERHLRRRFRAIVGVPVTAYVRNQRFQRARTSLSGAATVTAAIHDAGFGSPRAFYEHGAHQLGMTPTAYRAGATDERILFTSVRTAVGLILLASTERGLCAARIGTDEAPLLVELSAEFPRALLQRDDGGLAHLAATVADSLESHGETVSLPLDLRGTAFQLRVWEVLRGVERGSTLTYTELAERAGSPLAVRAVASACAANPVALVVPCHRVVRRDGSLGGYRWGLEVKRRLLDAESAGRAQGITERTSGESE